MAETSLLPASPARQPIGWRTLLRLPLHCLSVLTAAKSHKDNLIIGNAALNRRGLHIARRTVAARLGTRRRRALAGLVPTADRAAFERDGFVVKPGFLDPAVFEAFRSEIMGLRADAREALIGDTLTRLIPLDGPVLRRLPVVRSVLEGSDYLGLHAYVGSFRRRPHLYVQTVFSQHAPGAEPDIQSFYHTDTFHPTVKSWFFLQDVEGHAAPFTYVRGSHRATKRRLAWERRTSISARDADDRLTAEGSFRISEPEIQQLGYPAPEKMPVAANTLIVADTSGIHRRSTTTVQSARVSIWAYSRSNPFLPWAGGDLTGLPIVKEYALRLYWLLTDRVKDARKVQRDWRWVGERSPLSPP